MTGFEPAASCSQSRRATNCATPRYSIWLFFSQRRFIALLCPPSCKIVAHAAPKGTPCALFCCASSGSLHLPPAAVAFVTQSRRATNCATPRFFYFAFFLIFSVLPCFVRPLAKLSPMALLCNALRSVLLRFPALSARHTASTSRSRHLCYFNISGRVCQAGDWAGNCGAPSALMHTQRKTPPLWLTPGRWYSLGAKISPGTAGWTGSGHRYPAARLRWSCLRSPGAWPAARPPKRLHRS